MNYERYRLMLYHDRILDDSVIPIDNPVGVTYYIDTQFIDKFQGDKLIIFNEMFENLKSHMLNYLEEIYR